MTLLAKSYQKPSSATSVLRPNGTLPELILSPSIANIDGSKITDDVRATRVAQIPPHPSDGNPVFSKNSMPVRPATTVRPENRIALPAVALVIAIAVLLS